jgi:hypothetical protein
MKTCILAALTLTFGVTTFAADLSKFELTVNYSYFHYNPSVAAIKSQGFNGGGGQLQYNFSRLFALKADFEGYLSKQWTLNVGFPLGTSAGVIPAGTYKSNANMFTYQAGPVYGIHTSKLYIFTEALFGGASSNGYSDLVNTINAGGGKLAPVASQHPFSLSVGGGVDLNFGKRMAFRLGQFDYVLTRFTNPFTQSTNEDNFRYLGGVVFKFGEK